MARTRKYYNEETEKSPAQVETRGPETINGTIVNSLLVNVRKEPSLESEVLEIVKKGDKVTILDKVKDFYKVETKSKIIAYISSNFVEEG